MAALGAALAHFMSLRAWQINLQAHFGGGEVFTAFLTRALSSLGVPSTIFVRRGATHWKRLAIAADTELVPVADAGEIGQWLPRERAWFLGHGPLPESVSAPHLRTAIAHMPPQGRDPRAFERHDLVFGVSAWVLEGLRAGGAVAWNEPIYGVAEPRGAPDEQIHAASPYDFDERKLRDRTLAALSPVFSLIGKKPRYTKRQGLTLGIVSRLTPIKQYPSQFALLAPLLAARPGVNLEIFGAGGYASVRDLKAALAPLGARARFWGHQDNVAAAYAQLDYLLTGLPEKEALGLNVIEAQASGLPVLAVDAPPFTETVLEGKSGFLYKDPRGDAGADFARLIDQLLAGKARPDPRLAREHLEKFSFDAFCGRVERAVHAVRAKLAV